MMYMRATVSVATLIACAWVPLAFAQGTTIQPPQSAANDTSIFAPLEVTPPPSVYRGANGAPGPTYWQNRADYDLQATLDTTTGTMYGELTLRYTNHSPDALPFLWFQTEQNSFRLPAPAPTFGDIIDEFTEMVDGKSVPLQLEDHQSETKVTLPKPLSPGETATLQIRWHFLVPPRPTDQQDAMQHLARSIMSLRMGRDQTLYQIAQWYPRVNVYDDVNGWNIEPYDGTEEFYLEYGDFNLAVTVPSNYVVVATGTLQNSNEVLTPAEQARLAQAARSDTIVHIVTLAELKDGTAFPRHEGMVTWKFHATNVRDAVFAASPHYLWDATHWKGIITQALYRPKSAAAWNQVAVTARWSVQEYSEHWFPYPYPQISVAEGNSQSPIGGGMEYPMMSFDATSGDSIAVYRLITHEIGHNWFPMIVGSNERTHAWMDEGLNTFINAFSIARRFPSHAPEGEIDHPSDTTMQAINQGGDAYNQPAYVLELLRRDILGPVVFDSAFRTYIRRWAYKHPTPADFFRTINDVAGQNLDWFWREWFFVPTAFDQAIDSVRMAVSGTTTQVTVVYRNKQPGVMPLLVRFTFGDGTTHDVIYPVDIWKQGTRYTMSYTFMGKTVRQIHIDPDRHFVDLDRSNNRWISQ